MQFDLLLSNLRKDHSNITFESSDHFAWSSRARQISYKNPTNDKEISRSANKLLHELAHAQLEHSSYQSDAELLKIESAAWSLTKKLCLQYKVEFSKEEQDSSLASYISWASSRSECPNCQKNGLQTASTTFLCPNCSRKWSVGKSRFTRTYRH